MADTKVATFTIDSEKAELGVQRMSKLFQLMQKNAEDARKEMSQIFVDVHGQMNAPLDKNKKGVEDNTKAIKEYRSEQRLQNYVVREGSQTIMSLVFALSFLAQGEKGAAGTTKVLMQSVMAGVVAMNSLELTAFSLNRAFGKDAAGNVTRFGEIVGKWGGPIAIGVAGLVTLIGYLNESKKAAKEAAEEGLKKYREELEKMTPKQLESEAKRLEADYKFLQRQAKPTPMEKAVEETARMSGDPEMWSLLAMTGSRKSAAEDGLKMVKSHGEELGKVRPQLTGIKELEADIAVLRKDRDLVADPKKRLELSDQIAKKEFELAQAKKTTAERAADIAEKEKIQYEMHKSLPGQYLAALEAQKKVTLDAKARLEIEQKINDVKQEQAELEAKRTAIGLEARAKKVAAEEELFALWQDLHTENVLDPMKREEAEQERIHNDRLADIEELAARSTDMAEGDKARNEENIRYANALKSIQDKYHAEYLNNLAQGFQAVEQGITAIGVRSDSVLSRMIRMAQIAVAISKTLAQMNQPGADQTSGWLNIIGNALGFVGLFDSGGWTGPGSRNQVAGLVHKDEIVFEQPIVQRYRNELMSLRKSLQMGVPMPAAFPTSDNGGLGTAILVSEIRSLKEAIRQIEIRQPIVLAGMLEGQQFVRKEMPGYEKFRSGKQTDKS